MDTVKPASAGTFFGLVVGLSAPLWVIGAIVDITAYAPFGMSLSTMMVFLPVIVAVVLWSRAGRWSTVVCRLARAWRPPDNGGKAIVATATWPLITLAAFALAWGVGLSSWPALTVPAASLVVYAPIFVLLAACEEWGWTAYATEPLLRRLGPLLAGLVLGAVCAAWHLIPLLQMDRGIIWIIGWTLGTVAMRVIMILAYLATGRSVMTVIMMHASVNLCFVATTANNTTHNQMLVGMITVAVALLLIGVSRAGHVPPQPSRPVDAAR